METMAHTLLGLISEESPDYLSKKPFEAYERMLAAGEGAKDARLILSTLLCDAPKQTKKLKEPALSQYIQDECGMRPEVADELARVLKQVFTRKNAALWKEQSGSGLRALQEQPWKFLWEGEEEWETSNATMGCSSTVNAVLEVQNVDAVRVAAEPLLKTKPFATAEEIQELLAEKLCKELNDELEMYVNGDDYYPPAMDEFYANAEDTLGKACKSLGLRVTEFECDSDETDFEPIGRRRW